MNRRPQTTAGTLVSALVAASLLTAAPAFAGGHDDDEVIREGSCSGSTDWKVKAKTDDGRLEFEGEIDSNRNGQAWNYTIRHNGVVLSRGTRTTRAPSGSFSVERRAANTAGPDSFVGTSTNVRTGQTCRGTVTI